MQLIVPPQLNYNQLQTKTFVSYYKSWPIQPISNGGQYYPGEVIRIFMNTMTAGVFDPYRSHIELTVTCDISTLPVGLLQVDNSAQSFIQQLIISSFNKQIQRIVQYGVLAAYLTDIGISELYTEGKEVEGLGYSNIDNYQSLYTSSLSAGNAGHMVNWQNQIQVSLYAPGGVMPTIPVKTGFAFSWGTQNTSTGILSGIYRSHVSTMNTAWLNEYENVWWWYNYALSDMSQPNCNDYPRTTNLSYYGYNNNIRAEYLANHLVSDYIDSTSSYSKSQVRLDVSVQNNMFPAKFQDNTQYTTYIPDTVPYYYGDDATGTPMNSAYPMPNIPSLLGYNNLYSPNFAKGVRQPFISPTVPQCQMANGVILSSKIPISTRTFKIPLISAVIGILIPQDQFVLLPLQALNNLMIELTIDPYAMFTSGYNDISEFDNIGMALMQKRAFQVTRVVYNLHTYQFNNPQIDQLLHSSLVTGIAINTRFWQMGNQYQVENSQSLTNSWPISCNQQALNQIVVLFVPLDYQNLTFCRKHFRISNNITKLQLRIDMNYYPSQPLVGNGGNPIQVDSSGDNSIFLEQLYLANDYIFSKQKAAPKINAFNFAINERCYNVYNTHTFYDPGMIDVPTYQWTSNSINTDTAMGMPNLHENRYKGMAAYTYSFSPYSHSKNFLTGIDCRATKGFDILFSCNPQNWFPRPQTMFVYTRSSVIIEYSKQGIVNINK